MNHLRKCCGNGKIKKKKKTLTVDGYSLGTSYVT